MREASDKNDHRFPMTVFLMREDRPKYWEFHCVFCTAKIGEVDGDVVQVRDVNNDDYRPSRGPITVRCPGTDRKWCRMWYQFVLLN